jgi:hypothetical protein
VRDASDYTETVVLPESELTKDLHTPRSERRDGGVDTAFDQTLVLNDELEKFRRRRSVKSRAR